MSEFGRIVYEGGLFLYEPLRFALAAFSNPIPNQRVLAQSLVISMQRVLSVDLYEKI